MSETPKPSLGSDNHSGIHPLILENLVRTNFSHAPSYGTDALTLEAEEKFKELFGPSCQLFFVFNGTAANVLSLRALIESWQSVLCTDVSHLNVDECGAPEAIVGCKLVPVAHQNGKLQVDFMNSYVTRLGDQHFSQVAALSISQPTELGTVYTLEELREIRQFANKHNLFVHVDGARLANAIVYLNTSFSDFVETLRPDAISFGGTKNGILGGEAVLLFDEERAKNFKFIRKQLMQLPSKMRFIAAQFLAYLQSDLYRQIADHSHQAAKHLAKGLSSFAETPILYPVESNAVFTKIPKAWTKPLKEEMFFYVWDPGDWSIRLMTSFDTSFSEIDQFVHRMQQLRERSL